MTRTLARPVEKRTITGRELHRTGRPVPMPDPSYFSKGVVAELARLSKGTCYWPKPPCAVPITREVDGDMILNVQIAHIRAAHPNGPRYVEMDATERRRFANLILLCQAHHLKIDVIAPNDYSIEMLEKWKKDREASSYSTLSNMPDISDEGKLQSILTDAIKLQAKELEKQVSRFESAIAKLAAIDSDAASLLRERMQAAETLREAASMLAHTQSTSEILYVAGESLRHVDDIAYMLLEASARLQSLDRAANKLMDAASLAKPLESSAVKLTGFTADAYQIIKAIDKILSQRIQELQNLQDGMWH